MTTWWGWLARRAAASKGLVVALFLLVAATSGIIGGSVGHGDLAATSAARRAIAEAPPEAAGLRLQARLAPDAAAQDHLARARLAEGFAPVPIHVWTTITSEPRRLTSGSPDVRIVVWAGAHLASPALVLRAGEWPAPGSRAGTLHATAAATLGIGVGDVVTLGEESIEIVGTWLPADPGDLRWFGDPLVRSGADGDILGPLVVSEDVVREMVSDPFIRWSVTPDLDRLVAGDLPRLADGATRAADLAASADVTGRGLTSSGDLAPTAERATAQWAGARGMSLVPLSLLALVALVGLVQVAGMLAHARRREELLLLARGASRWQLFVGGAVESLLVALGGGVTGTALAALAIRGIAGGTSQTPVVLVAGGTTVCLVMGALLLVGLDRSRRLTASAPEAGNRVRAVAGIALVLLTGVMAGLTLWQRRRADAVVEADPDGVLRLNLLAALAPGLTLAALAVAGLVLLAPTLRLLERVLHRSRGAVAFLASAQSARALAVNAAVVVLTMLATGAITLAAVFGGTATAADRDLGLLAAGAPLRVGLVAEPPADGALRLPDVAGVEGVDEATPVWVDPAAKVGDTTVTAVVADPAALGRISLTPAGAQIPGGLLVPTQDGARALAVPAGATGLDIALAGRIIMNPWQELELQLLPELNAEAARLDQAVEPQAPSFEERMAWDLEARRTPIDVTTRVSVRDLTNGLGFLLDGPTLHLPAPAVGWATGDDDIRWEGSSATTSGRLALPAQGSWVIDAVRFSVDVGDVGGWGQELDLSVGLSVDGRALLGAPSADWLTDRAVPRRLAGVYLKAAEAAGTPKVWLETMKVGGRDRLHLASNQPPTPPTADLAGPTWTLRGPPTDFTTLTVAPVVAFTGSDPFGVMRDVPQRRPPVPVVLSRPLAEASSLAVGDVFELLTLAQRVPAIVVDVTDAVVGATDPDAVLVPAGPLAEHLGEQAHALPWPGEVWAASEAPERAAAEVETLAGVARVDVPLRAPGSSMASETSRDFAVAAGAAAGLALAGVAAAAATQLGLRRRDVAVLRALGMTPRQQVTSRALELGCSISLAALLGVAAGWATSALTVTQVARSGTHGLPRLSTPLQPNVPLWLGLLGGFLAAAAALVAMNASGVRRQASDTSYREDVT